jgi:hypothetical protein
MATATFSTPPGVFSRRFLVSAAALVSTGAAAELPFWAYCARAVPVSPFFGVTAPS